MKIFLAAAHGGGDPGAVANNTTEAAEVQKIVDACAEILRSQLPAGVELVVVPHNFELLGEVNFINQNSTDPSKDICIEINMNSNSGEPGTGVETYYGYKALAETLQSVLVRETGLKNRGVKEGNYLYFNSATEPGSALVELGFLNNAYDLEVVRTKGALSLAKAILAFVRNGETATTEPPPSLSDYKQKYEALRAKVQEFLRSLLRQVSSFSDSF
jgi:N-acetylmuramoyl-L-alanine amidase